jgi:uncharacterized protein YggE
MENTKNNIWKVGLATLSVLGFLFLALFIAQVKTIFYGPDLVDQPHIITVSGKGEVITIPDIATINFSVSETAKKVTDAQDAATAKTNSVLKALADAGVDTKKDVKTLSYNIGPHYEYQNGVCTQSYPGTCSPGKSVLTGYDVSQTIQVKIRDTSKAGNLFTVIGGFNVQSVDSLQFTVEDIDAKKDEAKAIAIEDAKTHAEVLARALGVHIIGIAGYQEEASGGNPYPVMYAMDSAVSSKGAAAPQIPTGEQKVTANVSVNYTIR